MRRMRALATTVSVLLVGGVLAPSLPLLGATSAAAAEVPGTISTAAAPAADQLAPAVVDLTIDAADIAADNVNGLTFKGFGVLSANSSSALLMDYKSQSPQEYAELLQVLFGGDHPLMNQVKIEMGNDRNNSTGPDPATMRWETEPANVTRDPGFQLAADARKVNPNLKVSILRWNAPAWATTNDKVYTWYTNTILAAYREYGYMVNYVNPGVNEHAADLTWTKDYANRVRTDTTGYVSGDPALAGFRDGEADLFHQIKVVISDEVNVGTFGGAMVADASLRDAVSVAGYHYSPNDDGAGNFKNLAQLYDTEIWNSEAQATFSNSSFRPNNNVADPTVVGTELGGTGGPLEMANTIVKGFVNSNRTHFIYQPAIGSFYEGGQYSFKELVSARDPWSGWIHYDAGLAILQHFSDFAVTGWENPENTAGIWRAVPQASATGAAGTNPVNGRNGAPSYLTLAAPDASDFSTVVVNDSEVALTYRIKPVNFALAPDATLAVWETRSADDGEAFDANSKQHVADLAPSAAGDYTVTVQPYSIATVTSLDVSTDAAWTTPLPVEGERTVLDVDPASGTLWQDDFDYSDRQVPVIAPGGGLSGETEGFVESRGGEAGTIPLYTWDRNGAFEAVRTDDAEWVLRQQVDQTAVGVGGAWNGGDPITAIGDRRWTNYQAGVDVRFEQPVAGNYAAIGARSSGGSSSNNLNGTAYALKLFTDGTWDFLRMGTKVTGGTAAGTGWDASASHRLTLRVAGGQIVGSVDGQQVFAWTDPTPFLSGWVDLASSFDYTGFDNLTIERVADAVPYYGEYLDNLEMNDLGSPPVAKLVYDGDWSHANGAGMFVYQRSTSTNRSAGAGLSYTFTGSGLDVLGANDGTAKLEVLVDGQLVATKAPSAAAGSFQKTFSVRGLPWGEHTVRLEVAAGTLVVDALAVVSAPATAAAPTDAVAAALATAQALDRDADFTDAGWAMLTANIASAQLAVDDPAGYRLDVEGVVQLVSRLDAASFPLAGRITSLPRVSLATTIDQVPTGLPATLTATLDDSTTRELPITWQLDGVDFSTPWAMVTVPGTYGGATTTARVEVVPLGLTAFGDVNATAATPLGYDSPAYLAMKGLVGDQLVNDAPDQVLTAGGTWGHWARNAAGVSDVQYKGVVAGSYDKLTTTGMYTANQVGAKAGYTFTLPAGRYTIAAGSSSWWPGSSRSANVALDYDGVSHPVGAITLNSSTPSRVLSYDVVLTQAGPVTISLTATNNQSPMLSWAAAVAGVYDVAYDANGGTGTLAEARSDLLWTDAGLVAPSEGLSRPGYGFSGWNTAADGSGRTAADTTTYADLVAGDRAALSVTLYAQWAPTAPTWVATTKYLPGDVVIHDGRAFEAQWQTRGQVPGASPWSAWAEIGAYLRCTSGFEQQWTASRVYTGGETVVHDGGLWTATWWTRNQEPGASPWGPWKRVGTC